MYKNMLVSLVVAALVAVIMSINPNPAWAKSTPLATASADATSLDRRPAYNREDILALQVRTTAAEKEIARLEGLRASFRVACADVTDAACQADIQRLTRQIKALKAEIERVDADRAADRVRIDGEIARIDAARAADRQWVGEQIARIDTAMETAKKERQALGLRLDVLEAAWRPVFWGMGNIGMSARTPMSAYGVSRTGFAPGLTVGTGLERVGMGLAFQGTWRAELGGELSGQTWGGSALVYDRDLRGRPNLSVGGGIAYNATRLVDDDSVIRYAATGPGISLVAMGRPGRFDGDHVHGQWVVQATISATRVFAYGQDYGVEPAVSLSLGFGPAVVSWAR